MKNTVRKFPKTLKRSEEKEEKGSGVLKVGYIMGNSGARGIGMGGGRGSAKIYGIINIRKKKDKNRGRKI